MSERAPVQLRPVTPADLPQIEAWLHEPHVARWWLTNSTIEQELADIRASIEGDDEFEVLIVECGARPIGWCQWYRWRDDPAEAAELGVGPDDVGIDYAIGVPSLLGLGVGTQLIAALLRHVRANTSAAIVVEPDADNAASRRVLEKNSFVLVGVRDLSFEVEDLSAIYRLDPTS